MAISLFVFYYTDTDQTDMPLATLSQILASNRQILCANNRWSISYSSVIHAGSTRDPCAIHKWYMRVIYAVHLSYTCFIRYLCAFHQWFKRDLHVNHNRSMRNTSAHCWFFGHTGIHPLHVSAILSTHKSRIEKYYAWSVGDPSVIPVWPALKNWIFQWGILPLVQMTHHFKAFLYTIMEQ